MKTMRIMVVDDHTLFRKGIACLISSRDDYKIVGEANDGIEAIAQARKLKPDLIILDINMPRMDGLTALRQILSELPKTKILMLTVSDDTDDLFDAIKSGAQGYLLKDLEPHQLMDMLDGVHRGEAAISGQMAARIFEHFMHEQVTPPNMKQPKKSSSNIEINSGESLSNREIEVLALIKAGLSNDEIAEKLVITRNTVKNHISNILNKLHMRNRVQLAVYAEYQQIDKNKD